MARLDFDPSEQEARNMDFEPLPSGRYLAQVTDSDIAPTKEGSGEMLKLTFEVLEAGFEGRKVFTNIVLTKKTGEVNATGRGILSSLCKSIGKVGMVKESEELHEKPVMIALTLKAASGEYQAGNEVKGFYPAPNGVVKLPSAPRTQAAPKAGIAAVSQVSEVAFDDDDIPF